MDAKVSTPSSNGALRDDALTESREFARHCWSGDVAWCNARLGASFSFIGPDPDQFGANEDESTATFSRYVETLHDITLTEESYRVVSAGGSICTVAGRSLLLAPPDAEKILARRECTTFVWRRIGKQLVLDHLHISIPVPSEEVGESYPVRAGTETYRYMRSLMKLGNSRNNVSIYGVDGSVHWVHPSQIVYLEADRKRTTVHCMTKDIVVPAVIKDAVEMVGNKVVRVHRSYAVNKDHVVELKAGRLLLDDGTSIAIPAKRIADVRAELSNN